ncbi:MAG: hypothetical protein JW860_06375 [Sedimentisphaerales bacterium]|nr:hypothetical protein [Sedimentisphaerales bacterium]
MVITILILTLMGLGLLQVGFGARLNSIKAKDNIASLLYAEAGYETALLWMGRQTDLMATLSNKNASVNLNSDNLKSASMPDTKLEQYYDVHVLFYNFYNALPVYRVVSNGYGKHFNHTVDVLVSVAVNSGWEIDDFGIPINPSRTTSAETFNTGDIIGMPIHINSQGGSPDDNTRDLVINGTPDFLSPVSLGESQYDRRNRNKYPQNLMDLFKGGVYFDQPERPSFDYERLASKTERFKADTKYHIQPRAHPGIRGGLPAVQMEFDVNSSGDGIIKLNDECTVITAPPGNWDYKINKDSLNNESRTTAKYEKYNLYAYHYVDRATKLDSGIRHINIQDTYVRQKFSGLQSSAGGQIFVDGNVILGGEQISTVKGKLTIIATGNIWIVNSVQYDGNHNADGLPTLENPNALGLISLDGVIKVIDPGLSAAGGGPPNKFFIRQDYKPVGIPSGPEIYNRSLPNNLVVEAAIMSGMGGWGVENVGSRSEEYDSVTQRLTVHGTITDAVRGAVGTGFQKHYFQDTRFALGILPGDVWLQTRYVPIPGGWNDYQNKTALGSR